MRRQHSRQATDFPPPHRIGLSGQRKGSAADTTKFTARQMDVNNGVAFIAPAGRLVNAHGVKSDGARCGEKALVKRLNFGGGQAAKIRDCGYRPASRLLQRDGSIGKIRVHLIGFRYRLEQTDE